MGGCRERADDRRDERRLPRSFVSRHPFSYLGLTALSSASHHDRRSSVPLSLTPSVRAAKRALRAIRYGGECKVNGQRQEPHEPTEVATEGAGWQEHRESIPPIDLTSLVLLSPLARGSSASRLFTFAVPLLHRVPRALRVVSSPTARAAPPGGTE